MITLFYFNYILIKNKNINIFLIFFFNIKIIFLLFKLYEFCHIIFLNYFNISKICAFKYLQMFDFLSIIVSFSKLKELY